MLALVLAVFAGAVVWILDFSFDRALRQSLESVAIDLRYDLQQHETDQNGMLDPTEEFVVSPVYIEVWTLEAGGKRKRIQFSENMRSRHLPVDPRAEVSFRLLSIPFVSRSDESALYQERVEIGGRTYLIAVATPIDGRDDLLESFVAFFIGLALLLYIAALYLGVRMVDRVLKPMQSITSTAASISKNNLSQRVPLPGARDEFYRLAETFNTMLARLEASFLEIRRFNVNVSHELKTPLTIIQGEAEVALMKPRQPEEYRRVLQSIVEEAGSMERIVESLLLLGKSDPGSLKKEFRPLRMDRLLSSLMERFAPAAEQRGIVLECVRCDTSEISGIPELVERALSNVLDNALKYTPPGKGKKIFLGVHARGGETVSVEIEDEGVGIPAEQIPHLFEPFYRGDDARGGTVPGYGLGLSIVEWILRLHGAEILVSPREGEGTRVRMTFKRLH